VQGLAVFLSKFSEVFSKSCKKNVLISSSSSGLLPSKIYSKCKYPSRAIIAHPFNPVYMLPGVEIVPGKKTSIKTLNKAKKFYESISMNPIMLKKELNGKSYKDKKVWWDYNIKTVAKNQYSKYKYPKKIKERLNEVNKYCEDNDINLIFINVPHNVEFSNRKNDFNLSNAEAQYKKDISEFGTVIDYDFPNQITNCKKCFTDPIHTNDSINLLMVREIFSDSLIIGKRL